TENSSSGGLKKVSFANPSSKPILKFVDTSQPAQYLEIFPKSFSEIKYGETKEFTIKVTAPSFVKKGIYPLSTTIAGKAVYRDYPVNVSKATGEVLSRKNITTDMIEKKTINLVVYTKSSPTYSPTTTEKEKLLQSIDILELVRGFDHTFSIKITNPFRDSILENVNLKVTGLLDEYLDIFPESYPKIEYGNTEEFKVRVSTPTYFEKGTYPLSADVTGSVFYPDYPTAVSDISGKTLSSKSFTLDMAETKTIDLIVHAVPVENAIKSLQLAETSIADMDGAGFSKSRVLKFSREAKEALEQGDYQRAEELGLEIQNIKETAFKTYALIQGLEEEIENAEKRGLNVIETKNLLYLASAAFEREDYVTAQQKVKDAQGLFSLETKGKVNYIKILLDYWYLVILATLIVLGMGIIAYQNITTLLVDRRLRGLRIEEINIANLIREARIKYYTDKTMTSVMYQETINKHEKRMVEIRQKRAKFRTQKTETLRLPDQLESLKNEYQSITELIKEAQNDYYNKKTLSREEYQKTVKQHKKRKAELESKIALLETMLEKKKRLAKIQKKPPIKEAKPVAEKVLKKKEIRKVEKKKEKKVVKKEKPKKKPEPRKEEEVKPKPLEVEKKPPEVKKEVEPPIIKPPEPKVLIKPEEMLVGTIEGIEGFYEAKLVEAGFITVKDLANATVSEVEEKTGLEDPYARYLISAAKEILEKAEKGGEVG
ncbi:MAG: hypothetical protein ACE5J5_06115, partial [Candidatus Hydrothermarchaeales archaeon]